MHRVWIEVALNGAWSRALQPGIPDTIESIIAEGVACARAGATIVHTHAYDGGGPQTFDWQVYARIIEGIRAQVDVPVYPSYPPIPTTTAGATPSFTDAAVRFAHIEALAARVCGDRPRQRQFHADRNDIGHQAGRHLHES
jgi:3-keto-5-aminohexanoate cleavage enzyme